MPRAVFGSDHEQYPSLDNLLPTKRTSQNRKIVSQALHLQQISDGHLELDRHELLGEGVPFVQVGRL
eukprot:3825835-Heterocapsa_arctica.AAC.1